MLSNIPCGLGGRTGRYLVLLLGMGIPVIVLWSFWYAINSDRDDISPLLNQLIPAGHCACQSATVFECQSCLEPLNVETNVTDADEWSFEYGRDDRNAGLSEDQCSVAFPGLFEDVERGARYWKDNGNIPKSRLDEVDLQPGMTRAMIYKGDLYIVSSSSKGEDHRRKTLATLSAMHRALAAMPLRRTAPDIEFIFSVEDKASDVVGVGYPIWVFARKPSEASLFLMPDFGFWAWDNMINGQNNEIGSYDDVVEKVKQVEQGVTFAEKEAKLVWRGKLSFAPKLRRTLLDVARGQQWSAVKELNWKVKQNYMTLEDHCKYQYIAHVEGTEPLHSAPLTTTPTNNPPPGRSYSASLKYRQACRSVIVAHKLQYIQHHHYLLSAHGPTQNYVEVERDFSDLANTMARLLADPAEAQRIADNSVRTFRERYLTPAAEACYWRRLWAAYASVSESPKLWRDEARRTKRGLRFETFVLLSSGEMYEFHAA